MSRPSKEVTAALDDRARQALTIARTFDPSCSEATAFCLATERPEASIQRLQAAIRAATRRERGQRVFTPRRPKGAEAPPKQLTADFGVLAAPVEPFHLDDPAAIAELAEVIAALAADAEAVAALAEIDAIDDIAVNRADRAALALGLTTRRAQQIRKKALASGDPKLAWAEAIWFSADRSAARARREAAARARRRRAASSTSQAQGVLL